ncbi:MAG: GxxExxY protein [Capsulimonadaceae bacterium]
MRSLNNGKHGNHRKGTYRCDLVCYGTIVLELKAVHNPLPEQKAQLLNYLRANGRELGFLINFGSYPKAEIERVVAFDRSIEDTDQDELFLNNSVSEFQFPRFPCFPLLKLLFRIPPIPDSVVL